MSSSRLQHRALHEELTFSQIYPLLLQCPRLADSIGLERAMKFIQLASRLKRDILHSQRFDFPLTEIPSCLPPHISAFLASAVGISGPFVEACWTAFKHTIWDRTQCPIDLPTFYHYGTNYSICESFYGPL
jgi:hypothetical protein